MNDEFPVTHPPLPADQLDRIGACRHSEDARLLLREVERLRNLETHTRDLLAKLERGYPATPDDLQFLVLAIKAALAGKLPSAGKYGSDPRA